MRPAGLVAASRDEERNRMKTNFRGFKYDNCDFPLSLKGSLLSIAFVLGSEMYHPNNNQKKNDAIATAVTVFTLATIIVIATAGPTTIIGINRSADAFVIPGLGEGRTD
jgi:hypothetical protein